MIRIVFFGTSDFAIPSLDKLAKSELCDVMAVVTQPDKPVGRKQELVPSPVKTKALELELRVIQPKKLTKKVIADLLRSHKIYDIRFDLFVVVSYGKIIPKEVLEIPTYGTVNLHPSLLPKYRGPSPIQTAILNGDTETGITSMLLDEKMDHGPILNQESRIMNQDETYETLLKKLAEQGADLLIKTILGCVAAQGQSLLQRTVLFPDNIKPREQDHTKATYTKLITKEDGQIDWSSSSREIYNQWRAYQPWPGVFTWMGGKRVKILSLYLSPLARGEMQEGGVTTAQRTPPPNRSRASTGRPSPSDPLTRGRKFGSIQSLDNHLLVLCGDDNYLEILSLQPEGKKILTAGEFVRGYKVERFETFPLLDKEG